MVNTQNNTSSHLISGSPASEAHPGFLAAVDALNRESLILFSVPLDEAQLECLNDPNRFLEALGMLEDLEARLGFDVLQMRAALITRCGNGGGAPLILSQYPNFSAVTIDGCCTAMCHPVKNGDYLVVMDPDASGVPHVLDTTVVVGRYDSRFQLLGGEDMHREIKVSDLSSWLDDELASSLYR